MKKILFIGMTLSVIAHATAQTRNNPILQYSEPYAMMRNPVYKSGPAYNVSGTATYQYKEEVDGDRIFYGAFTFKKESGASFISSDITPFLFITITGVYKDGK